MLELELRSVLAVRRIEEVLVGIVVAGDGTAAVAGMAAVAVGMGVVAVGVEVVGAYGKPGRERTRRRRR